MNNTRHTENETIVMHILLHSYPLFYSSVSMWCIPIWWICNLLGVGARVSLVLIQAMRYLRLSELPERTWLILPQNLLVRRVQDVYYQFQLLECGMLASSLSCSVSLLPVNSSLKISLFMYMWLM